MKQAIAPIANIARLSTAGAALRSRAIGMPGIGLIWGPSGYGKSTAAAWWRSQVDAVYVRALRTWTAGGMAVAILRELRAAAPQRISAQVERIVELLRETGRPLLIDEADYVVDNGRLIDTLRRRGAGRVKRRSGIVRSSRRPGAPRALPTPAWKAGVKPPVSISAGSGKMMSRPPTIVSAPPAASMGAGSVGASAPASTTAPSATKAGAASVRAAAAATRIAPSADSTGSGIVTGADATRATVPAALRLGRGSTASRLAVLGAPSIDPVALSAGSGSVGSSAPVIVTAPAAVRAGGASVTSTVPTTPKPPWAVKLGAGRVRSALPCTDTAPAALSVGDAISKSALAAISIVPVTLSAGAGRVAASAPPIASVITTVLDVATRRVVGWSVAVAESAIAVADALADACTRAAIPAYWYTDNGPGYVNAAMDDPALGLLARLGITAARSLPYNSQARGAIEALNKNLWVRAARSLATLLEARRQLLQARLDTAPSAPPCDTEA